MPQTSAAHDDRGAFVIIGACAGAFVYVAYAIHGAPAHLARATHHPDGTITLRPVGGPYTRLDLAVDAGRWRAEREAYAATAQYQCARCGTPITLVDGTWVSMDYTTTAGGLSSCPPDPDATRVERHVPRKRRQRSSHHAVAAMAERDIGAVLNAVADDILQVTNVGDEGLRDAVNLMVNAVPVYLRRGWRKHDPAAARVRLAEVADSEYGDENDLNTIIGRIQAGVR